MKEKELLNLMLEHQDRLNSQIHPEWRKQRFPWHRAIWMECSELMDCFPWKWWSETEREPDWENVQVELADLWHFVLSWTLQRLVLEAAVVELATDYEFVRVNSKNDRADVLHLLETLVQAAVEERPYLTHQLFFRLLFRLKLDLKSLAGIYFGKNILNRFRQAHGLKEGRYRREWNGVEDNRVMLRLIEDLEVLPLERFEAELTRRLEEAYGKA